MGAGGSRVSGGMLAALLALILGAAQAQASPTPGEPLAIDAGDGERTSPAGTSTPEATPTPAPTPSPTPAPPARSLQLVYTGDSKGVGSGLYPMELMRRLMEQDEARPTAVEITHGLAAQGPWIAQAEDGGVATLVGVISSGDVRCDAPTLASGVTERAELLIASGDAPPPWLAGVSPHAQALSLDVRRCQGAAGARVTLFAPTGTEGEPRWTLDAFELRLGLRMETAGGRLLLVGAPLQEASRTFARLLTLRAQLPDALYVDAGSWLDGASTVDPGKPSLYRPLRYDMQARLRPSALVPGYTELVVGLPTFAAEIEGLDLPWLATNLILDEEGPSFPRWRIVDAPSPGGPVRVAFLGVLDPVLLEWIPQLKAQGVGIGDPVEALRQAVAELAALEDPPAVVVALTTARGDVQEAIRREVRGIDVMLGDSSLATLRVEETVTRVRSLDRDVKGAALTLPLDGVGVMEMTLDEEGSPETVAFRPSLVGADVPMDPETTAAITRVRADFYPQKDHPLVSTPDATTPFDQATWDSLLCQAVLQRTGGDVVILRPLPRPPRFPGILTELHLLNQLPILDVLEAHEVPGYKLADVLKRLYGTDLVACGTDLDRASPAVRGRRVEADRTYRLITTDHTRTGTVLGSVLEGVHSSRWLDQPVQGRIEGPGGAPVTLAQGVADGLRAVRDEQGSAEAVAPTLLARAPAWDRPQLLLRVRQLSIQVERFEGAGDDAYAEIPETLATSPSSFTLGSAADLALDYTSTSVYADLRWRSGYTTLSVDEEEAQETYDDWELSSSISLPARTFPGDSRLRFMPFSELSLDSEFTPVEQEDGTENPRQADLYLTVGLSARPVGPLRSLKFGPFANRDLARLGDKPLEYGARLVVETLHTFGPSLRLTTFGGARWFARTDADDASDLRFKALGEVRLSLPLATWLDTSMFAQGFVFQGRVEETSAVGTSWKLGFALDLRGAFLMGR